MIDELADLNGDWELCWDEDGLTPFLAAKLHFADGVATDEHGEAGRYEAVPGGLRLTMPRACLGAGENVWTMIRVGDGYEGEINREPGEGAEGDGGPELWELRYSLVRAG